MSWLLTDAQQLDVRAEIAGTTNPIEFARELSPAMCKAQARHIFERLNEDCDDKVHDGYQLCKSECPQCMAEFEKELTGEK
jgi:hypothetical protein